MKPIRLLAAAAALLLAAGAVSAQPAAGAGPGASAPRGGPGGPGHMGGRGGRDFTPGWSMMTRAERKEHQAKMGSMTNHEECRAYMEKHHQEMAARAKEKGRAVPTQPRRDGCAGLKR